MSTCFVAVIFLDIIMPVMDGIKATRHIRNFEVDNGVNSGKKALILALTASASITDRDLALSAGCNDYLVKPISFSTLISLCLVALICRLA